MEIRLIGSVVADYVTEFTDEKTKETKKSRYLQVLTGEGKDIKVYKIKIPYDAPSVETHKPEYYSIDNIEMKEWQMNGRAGVSYSLK